MSKHSIEYAESAGHEVKILTSIYRNVEPGVHEFQLDLYRRRKDSGRFYEPGGCNNLTIEAARQLRDRLTELLERVQ